MDKRNSHISTFSGGMDRDTNFANMPKEKYYELKNGRVVVNNYSNSLSITPFKQPAKLIYLSDEKYGSADDIIIGSILVRDGENFKLTIFTTQTSVSNKDKIWVLNLSNNTITRRYEGSLNFDKTHLIDGVSKYENSSNIKVYWWDNLNPFRYCNIEDAQLYTYTSSSFDNVPDFEYEQPKFISVNSSGEYKSGKVQYCYRLYKLDGTSTNISPFSGMIHLTGPNIDEESISSQSYLGSPKQTTTNTGKSVSMQIIGASGSSLLFNRIIVYSIYYDTANQPPVVKKIIDTAYGTSIFSFTDTGNMPGATIVDINDVLFENFMPYPKAGVTKHNSLYLGNIKKDNFILPEEMYKGLRAFRFDISTNNMFLDGNSKTISSTNDYDSIGLTNNCVLLKQAQRDRYKYKRNSTILGGEGKYISYEFFIKQVILDNQTDSSIYPGVAQDSTTGMYDLNSSQVSKNYPSQFSFTDYNSPSINYIGAGYMRDEVYPFAIVFRNTKGQKSFPIWIADIKMPVFQDTDGKVTYSINGVEYYDYNITSRETGDLTTDLYANILGIKFTIDYLSLKTINEFEDIVGWEIVRMPRKPEDRSIVAQGLMAALQEYNGKYYYNKHDPDPYSASSAYMSLFSRDTQAIFISPEFMFGTVSSKQFDIPFKNNDYILHSYKYLNNTDGVTLGPYNFVRKFTSTNTSLVTKKVTLTSTKQLLSFTPTTLPNGNEVSIHFNPNESQTLDPDFYETNIRGSSLALLSADDLSATNGGIIGAVNYCRDIDDTAYGGNTYSSRFNRSYISTMNYSNLNSSDTQSLMVLGGDTYISYFDILSKMYGYSPTQGVNYTDNYTKRSQSIHFIPIESTINLNLRHGYFYSKVLTGSQRNFDYWWNNTDIQFPVFMETAGTYYSSNGGTIAGQIQTEDYYLYNTVYSQYPLYPIYTPLPENFIDTEKFDARVIYSDTKITGESIDSWLIFRPLNFKDLDYEYGPINKLIKFKDNVYCFQTKAFSVLSINPRVALTSDSGLPVQLGTGSKLERFDYLSTKYGSYHRFGSIATDTGLYFIDGLNKKLMIFVGENIPLSDLKGVYSYINKELQNNELTTDSGYDGMSFMQYDQINNDVLFNFINTNSLSYGVSITYNELLKAFVSINSLSSRNIETIPVEPPTTSIVIRDLRNSFINPTNNGLVVFKGDMIFSYDSQYNIDSLTELSSIVNEAYTERKVFDNLYFDLDIIYPYDNKTYNHVHTLSAHQLSECVTKIQFYNDYQNTSNITPLLKTGWQTPSGYNTSRLEREYMFQIPGNDIINPADNILDKENTYKEKTIQIPHPAFRDRMRGKYVICKIKLKCFEDNLPNLPNLTLKTFALNYLRTLYRISY